MTLLASEADTGKRLDVFLQERLAEYSRSRIQQWVKDGKALVNGAAGRASTRLRGGERIEVTPAEPRPLRATPEEIPLRILYEDGDVIAVDKPAGMVVHAGAGVSSGTLVNALLHHFGALSQVGGELRPGIVHRLDRYTSGVLLVARHDAAHRGLAAQFAAREVRKTYLALVHGTMKEDRGRIEKPISRDPAARVRMTARRAGGRWALTEYRVLTRYRGFTLLEVEIKTGRTHQIRAHLASLGRPVAGDRLYGAPARAPGEPKLERFFLHAWRIRFLQPSSGVPIALESPLPPELRAWLEGLERLEGSGAGSL